MSSPIEDRDVIFITPNTNNQDGSQTVLILEPCEAEEDQEDPKIELVDLTAEVKNTGQIAVVSTNTSTGALEITLTDKTMEQPEPEQMDQDQPEIIDDDFEIVKKEMEEDVDIEEIEYSEPVEMKPTEEELSQEDDVEEGALFIDDVKTVEDPAPEQIESRTAESPDKIISETDNTLEQVKNMIEQAEIVINDTETELNSEEKGEEENDIKIVGETNGSLNEVAVIHGQVMEVPTSSAEKVENPSQSELDSTNTALTLLELAGSTPAVEGPGAAKVSEKAKLIAVSSEGDEGQKLTQVATLTLPVTFSSESSVEVDQTSVSTLDPGVVRSARRMEKLIEGDSPCTLGRRSISSKEIAEELDERTKQKYPDLEPGHDYIFAMKLAHRLASKIVEKTEVESTDVAEKSNSDSTKPAETTNEQELVNKLPNSQGKPVKTTKKSLTKSLSSDKIELLKILEDDPDDPSSLEIPQNLEKLVEQKPRIASKRKSHFTPLLKLHPELEKELALKQLDDFKTSVKRKRTATPKAVASAEQNNNSKRKKQKVSSSSNVVDSPSATADPSQVTEFLTVEGQEFIGEQLKDSKLLKQYSNKRLSRPETPPLDLPMDLLLNGEEEAVEGNAKNKIFKATNPRRRKAELQLKKKNHYANVLKRNKPQKRRGRPPKKKAILPPDDMLTLELLHKATTRQEKPKNGLDKNTSEPAAGKANASPSTDKEEKTPKSRKMREIDRLLGDEGAINLLFAIQEKNAGGTTKRGVLPSVRRKKKDLILKTKLVKSAVLSMTNPTPEGTKISLRGQQAKDGGGDHADTSMRKMSVDSHDSHSISSPPPADSFPFPAKIVPAEASRIIRRHSSSSNYSSRSNSPRRLSVDGERVHVMSPEPAVQEMGQGDAPVTPASKLKPPRGTPQSAAASRKLNLSTEEKPKPQQTPREKKVTMNRAQADKLARALLRPSPIRRGRPRKIPLPHPNPELDSSLAAVLEDFTRNAENVDKNIPVEPVKKPAPAPVSPQTKQVKEKNKVSTPVQPKPVPKLSVVYKELSLKRVGQLVEIIISPSSTKLKNALNANVLRELTSVLTGLTKDDNCRAVLVSSTGSVFCQGVDFLSLVHQENAERKTALELAIAIKEFIKALALFSKVVVAAVHGPAVGLGVTMLPLFDLVLAAETATFHTPYAKLGQIPEGGATLTMPTLLGPTVTSELLYAARKLTAEEAMKFGLVTRVLPQQDFREQVMSVVEPIATQSSQCMEATKALLRHSLHVTLETTLVSETHLLIQHWGSDECQNNFSKYLSTSTHPVPLALQDT